MSDVSKRDMANAEANITGALKEKRFNRAMETQFTSSDNIGTYNQYNLITVITIITVIISAYGALFINVYYWILVPLLILLDRILTARQRKIRNERSKLILQDLKETAVNTSNTVKCQHCNKNTHESLDFCTNCGK